METKLFALHLKTELNIKKSASSQTWVRWGTIEAANKKEAHTKLLEMYCKHQTVGSFPKGFSIDEIEN